MAVLPLALEKLSQQDQKAGQTHNFLLSQKHYR
jgi:hypothetical protein